MGYKELWDIKVKMGLWDIKIKIKIIIFMMGLWDIKDKNKNGTMGYEK